MAELLFVAFLVWFGFVVYLSPVLVVFLSFIWAFNLNVRGSLCVAMANSFIVLLKHGIFLVLIPVRFSMNIHVVYSSIVVWIICPLIHTTGRSLYWSLLFENSLQTSVSNSVCQHQQLLSLLAKNGFFRNVGISILVPI